METPSLNAVFSSRAMRRRYEVWFLRFALADGSGAWWLRYLLLNLGRSCAGGCGGKFNFPGYPVQVWATWFPRGEAPQSFIAGFPQGDLALSERFVSPFSLECAGQQIGEDSCRAAIEVGGHRISWDLRYTFSLAYSMSEKNWIGFSRTPHAAAVFSGRITFDDRTWEAAPIGFGLQGHNCGYRHRRFWTWAHVLAPPPGEEQPSSFEALEYEIGLGFRFRRAILHHDGVTYDFGRLKSIERTLDPFRWTVHCSRREDATTLVAILDGTGSSAHRLPYVKTNCSGTFEVTNNSLASAKLYLKRPGEGAVELRTQNRSGGAVLEMSGK
ncbi:MAG TPA: hypothetical protein VEU31_00255 [Candidatus Acidoferrales bacterium]|nr:hypothetical protein [Candidatus Acidoferrales bacterium]